VAAGLAYRPLAETVRDTLAWLAATPPTGEGERSGLVQSGLSPEREAAVLAAWRQQSNGV
jgi:2'-hydroxyisoflavone reductase